MSRTTLKPEQAQEIAVDYIRQRESAPDTTIQMINHEPFSWAGIPAYLFRGTMTRNTVNATASVWLPTVEQCSFQIWISADDGNVIGYKPDKWATQNAGPTSYHEPPPDPVIAEPAEPIYGSDPFRTHVGSPVDDMLDRMADRATKRADAELKTAKAEEIRSKGNRFRWSL